MAHGPTNYDSWNSFTSTTTTAGTTQCNCCCTCWAQRWIIRRATEIRDRCYCRLISMFGDAFSRVASFSSSVSSSLSSSLDAGFKTAEENCSLGVGLVRSASAVLIRTASAPPLKALNQSGSAPTSSLVRSNSQDQVAQDAALAAILAVEASSRKTRKTVRGEREVLLTALPVTADYTVHAGENCQGD